MTDDLIAIRLNYLIGAFDIDIIVKIKLNKADRKQDFQLWDLTK